MRACVCVRVCVCVCVCVCVNVSVYGCACVYMRPSVNLSMPSVRLSKYVCVPWCRSSWWTKVSGLRPLLGLLTSDRIKKFFGLIKYHIYLWLSVCLLVCPPSVLHLSMSSVRLSIRVCNPTVYLSMSFRLLKDTKFRISRFDCAIGFSSTYAIIRLKRGKMLSLDQTD